MRRAALATAALACCGGPAAPTASAKAPVVRQLVAFKSGAAVERKVRARGLTAKVGRRRCAVSTGTALAALLRSKPGAIRLRDYGSCSRRGRDSGQLFVRSIRSDRNRGLDGWVYKVGRKTATAGAADPGGAFGRGRLRSGARVTWFYGRQRGGSFQRTLELTAKQSGTGTVVVRVRGYDDDGRGIAIKGAEVSARGASALTDERGAALLKVPVGSYVVRASKEGLIPSFGERVTVR